MANADDLAGEPLLSFEKWPIYGLFGTTGFVTFLWFACSALDVWWEGIIFIAAGVCAGVSVDGAMVATIVGMRAGRRGFWSYLTMAFNSLVLAAIGIAQFGGFTKELETVLHGAFALAAFSYLMHLQQPLQPPKRLKEELQQLRNELSGWMGTYESMKQQAEQERTRADQAVAQSLLLDADLQRARAALDERLVLPAPEAASDDMLVGVGGTAITLGRLQEIIAEAIEKGDTPSIATLSRKVKR